MEAQQIKHLEGRALVIAMWGNSFMFCAGILGAIYSNSNAILMDGLFSLIGLAAAVIGRKISRKIDAGPDKHRPMGYAADEAIFSTFRALSLLGLILFASASALLNVIKYQFGEGSAALHFAPMTVYFLVVGTASFSLWMVHRFSWIRTGKASEILRLEAKATFFDGIITAVAAFGLGAIYFLKDGFLAPIAPIGDSLVVLVLCLAAAGQYWRDFLSGLGELAGVTGSPEKILIAKRAIRPSIACFGGAITDLSVIKIGRSHLVTVYYDPQRPVSAQEVDELTLKMNRDVEKTLPRSEVLLLITQYPRRWPDSISQS